MSRGSASTDSLGIHGLDDEPQSGEQHGSKGEEEEAVARFERAVDENEETRQKEAKVEQKVESSQLAGVASSVGITGSASAELGPHGDPDNSWDDDDSLGEISNSAR